MAVSLAKSVLVLGLPFFALITVANDHHLLPTLPRQFTAVIEANIINKNYTVVMKEWYDSINDRGRIDSFSKREHGSTSNIYDFIQDRYYHTNKSGCYWGDTKHLKSFLVSRSSGSPHLTSSEKLFRFGGDIKEIYIGQDYVRGILCDKWRANIQCSGCQVNYTLDYFFSALSWSFPEPRNIQIPIRAELNGVRRNSINYTSMQPIIPPVITNFKHIYDYTSFQVGPPNASNFKRPCGRECISTNQTWNSSTLPATKCPTICNNNEEDDDEVDDNNNKEDDKANDDNEGNGDDESSKVNQWTSSAIAGLSIGCLVIGILMGMIISYIIRHICRKNEDLNVVKKSAVVSSSMNLLPRSS